MPKRVVPKDRSVGIETAGDVREFCRIMGFDCRVTEDNPGRILKVEVTADGSPVLSSGWRHYDYVYTLSCSGLTEKEIVDSFRHTLERTRWLVIRRSYTIKVPFGEKTVTEETKIDFPDFRTPAELEVKLACQN